MSRALFSYLLLLPIFFVSPVVDGFAQPGRTGAISGILTDSLTRIPVEYAAVGIVDQTTGQVVNGGLADDKGAFSFSGLPFGTYRVDISFIGYKPFSRDNIILTPQSPAYDCGVVLLQLESQFLEEIKVVGEAALIEARPDKIVYNADKDITSRGGDAADVLRKVPLLTVDFDGNVSLRGSENITILINGRPSGMFSNNVADALRMMPADQIQSVEVITSPSARYDGEGTAGIINIITKKKSIAGTAGSIELSSGNRHNRGNANLNFGKGKFGLNFSAGGHYSPPQTGSYRFLREEFMVPVDSSLLLQQDGSNRSSRLGFRTNLGLEYNFNPKNTLSASVSYRGFDSKNLNDVLSNYSSLTGGIIDAYQRQTNSKSSRGGLDVGLDYKRNFAKKGHELAIAIEVERDFNETDADYAQHYTMPEEQTDLLENNLNDGSNREIKIQADYTHPFSQAIKVEAGLKGTLRSITSDFGFSRYDADQQQWFQDLSRTDIFYYDQDVYAGYLSGTFNLNTRMTLITGARLEVTDLGGHFKTVDLPFANTYRNILPNVTISRKIGDFNQVKVSYNQRIQRPGMRHVNPFIEYNDIRDISFGNPNLSPELMHQVELGGNIFIGGNMVNVSIYGRRTEDLIESLLRINDEGISESTFQNFGNRTAAGVNVFGSLNIGKLTLRGGFDINMWKAKGTFAGEVLTNTATDYNGRLNATWNISETLKAEGFTFFRSPVNTVQGKIPSWSMMSFGVKKELLDRRLTIGVSLVEPFRENLRFESDQSGTGFHQNSIRLRPVRSFGISAGYRFGKLDFKERSQGGKNNRDSNDLKEDQSGENQMQG